MCCTAWHKASSDPQQFRVPIKHHHPYGVFFYVLHIGRAPQSQGWKLEGKERGGGREAPYSSLIAGSTLCHIERALKEDDNDNNNNDDDDDAAAAAAAAAATAASHLFKTATSGNFFFASGLRASTEKVLKGRFKYFKTFYIKKVFFSQ